MKLREQKESRLQPKLKEKYTMCKLKPVLVCKADILNNFILNKRKILRNYY